MRIVKYYLTLSLLVLGIITVQSQTSRDKKVLKAYKIYESGEYFRAEELLKDAYERVKTDKEKADIIMQIAECYRRTNQPKKAELWFNKAIKKEFADPIVYLFYADALKMNEKYPEALEQYTKYKSLVPNDIRADNGITSCKLAVEWKANPNGYIVEEAYFFNSKMSDFAPAFARDDYGTVLFTSDREESTGKEKHGATGQKFSDIYMSTVDKQGKWSIPAPIDVNINTANEEGTPAFDGGYNILYFTRCEKNKNKAQGCQIYQSTRDQESWSKPELIELAKDSVIVAHPAPSKDGNTLYFASDMAGGIGGKDIWMSVKEGSKWSAPKNLGDKINTPGDEVFPFIHADGTLYFSSNGHLGMGGLDIFKAEKSKNDQWRVQNMGYPVNSSSDDFGIIFEAETERGFFTSSRGVKGTDDLYMFVLPPIRYSLTGILTNEKNNKPVENGEIKLISSEGSTMTFKTDEKGYFKFMLKPATDYIILASAENYLKGKSKQSTKGFDKSQEFTTTIKLAPIDAVIEIPNIFYDFGKFELNEPSKQSLFNLVEIMNDNPSITIEFMSHTDSRGSDKTNEELSQKRAQSAIDFLISEGINADRLKAKGYGESEPKVVDEKISQQAPYFKIGDVLTEEYINNLPSEDYQEIAYQINRRTEFRVLTTSYEDKKKK